MTTEPQISEKTAVKTTVSKVPQPHGGALNDGGTPNNKGGGRPRDEWKHTLQGLASREETIAHVRAVLDEGPDHPFFFRALDYATDHGFGKANQSLSFTLEELINLPSSDLKEIEKKLI